MSRNAQRQLARLILRFHDNDPVTAWSETERSAWVAGAMHVWSVLSKTNPLTLSDVREMAKPTTEETR